MIQRTLQAFSFFIFILTTSLTQAKVTLFTLSPDGGHTRYLIPTPEGQDPQGIWQKYRQFLKSEEMQFLIPNSVSALDANEFSIRNENPQTSAVLLANTANDFLPDQGRIPNWLKILKTRGFDGTVIPPGITSVLSLADKNDFLAQVATSYAVMLPLGGQDIDPHLYGENPDGTNEYHPLRDRLEQEIIRTYIDKKYGFIYATCRGAQLTAVTMGYKLIQDLPSQKPGALDHLKTEHLLVLHSTKNRLLNLAWWDAPNLLVNSYHHQAIIFKPDGPLELAATAPDGTTEALEFKNGRGLLLQSHPELTIAGDNLGSIKASNRIFDSLLERAKTSFRFTCGKVYRFF